MIFSRAVNSTGRSYSSAWLVSEVQAQLSRFLWNNGRVRNSLAHTTIMRWIARYVPEFEKRWNRFACRVGTSWRVERNLCERSKASGHIFTCCRQARKDGSIFCSAPCGAVAAAKAFFRRASRGQGRLPQRDHARRLSGFASGGRGKSLANISGGKRLTFDPQNKLK